MSRITAIAVARPGLSQLAQPPHDLEPVDAGQHQVEHDEVGPPLARELDRPRPVPGDARVVARAREIARDDLGDRRLVVDDEHGAAGGHAGDCGRRTAGSQAPPGFAFTV